MYAFEKRYQTIISQSAKIAIQRIPMQISTENKEITIGENWDVMAVDYQSSIHFWSPRSDSLASSWILGSKAEVGDKVLVGKVERVSYNQMSFPMIYSLSSLFKLSLLISSWWETIWFIISITLILKSSHLNVQYVDGEGCHKNASRSPTIVCYPTWACMLHLPIEWYIWLRVG